MDFKVGDKVRIVKPDGIEYLTTYGEDHYHVGIYWNDEMDGLIGEEGVVDCVGGNYGINVVTPHHNLNYLPSWLELVERESTLKKRKHHDMIVQWAKDDSLEVEASRNDSGIWFITECPSWCENLKYRFKPKTKQVTISEIKAVFGDDIEIVGD